MKKVSILVVLVSLVLMLASNLLAGETFKNRRDRIWNSDNNRSITRDFDRDGLPNFVDPFDNNKYKSDFQKDYDHDGIPNAVDSFDNKFYKP